ncbi:MAG: hypothetical protein AAGD13_05085 [Pseudomonadota bacterium]
MFLKEVTPAARTPVPLREFGAHLRLSHGFNDDGSEDGLLELYLRNATAMVERKTSLALINRICTLQVPCWNRDGHLVMPIGPVTSIDTIQFKSPTSTVDLDESDWSLQAATTRQKLTGSLGGALWPIPHGSIAELRFTAGFGGTWNDVPPDLRQAVIILAAHLYENRFGELAGSETGDMPVGVLAAIERHRPIRL